MPGTLFLVATPIGNLEDITLRALRVLRTVDLIAAEDTRRTSKLLAHFGIAGQLTSLHAHSAPSKVAALVSRLTAGASVALVSDAGTPLISDPGHELVSAAIEAGVSVDPIPGACAQITAVTASGFDLGKVLFLGFAPNRGSDRKRWFSGLAKRDETLVFFEAPHRIRDTLAALEMNVPRRSVCLARELTKMHQEFIRGTPEEVQKRLVSEKGEFTVVVGPDIGDTTKHNSIPATDVLLSAFESAVAQGGTRRAAITSVARSFGLSSKDVYQAIEKAKNIGH